MPVHNTPRANITRVHRHNKVTFDIAQRLGFETAKNDRSKFHFSTFSTFRWPKKPKRYAANGIIDFFSFVFLHFSVGMMNCNIKKSEFISHFIFAPFYFSHRRNEASVRTRSEKCPYTAHCAPILLKSISTMKSRSKLLRKRLVNKNDRSNNFGITFLLLTIESGGPKSKNATKSSTFHLSKWA